MKLFTNRQQRIHLHCKKLISSLSIILGATGFFLTF